MAQPVRHSLLQALARVPLFETLDDGLLVTVAGGSSNLAYGPGATVFEPGDPAEAVYVVLRGAVRIRDGGHEIATIEAGDTFGERSLLFDAVHSKTAEAAVDSELLVLPKSCLSELVEFHPRLEESLRRRWEERRAAPRAAVVAAPPSR
jgi:CRP/FNR family transcriptional regulator, cyclic AMP receptor protein